jgi:ABC-2 type transport system ATP-binding protein
MNVIEVSELTKVYDPRLRKGGILALDRVSLTVATGEIFGLLGPNGAGKTTLFKTLLGLTAATSGEASLNGSSPADPTSRLGVGYLPENARYPGHLTGLGLLELTGRLYGLNSGQIDARTQRLLELVQMDKWANTKIKKYSKGMVQRIGLAQALVADPDILLLDEPTDGIDPLGKVEFRQMFLRLKAEGKTIVLNSHLLSEVELAADRAGILNRGRLVRVGTIDQLTSKKSQFEIEADLGDQLVELPPEIGTKVFVSASRLVVELKRDEDINYVIDQLRAKRISIRSIKPLKVSLEQSFFETVTDQSKGPVS